MPALDPTLKQPPAPPIAAGREPQSPGSLKRYDRLLLLLLQAWGAVALMALALVPLRFLPAEDAVILFDYSRNLAERGAITFLAGGPHVEGATDFGWLVLVAAAMRCGVSPFWFCAAADVVALAMLAAVLLRLASLQLSVARVLAIAGSAALFRPIFAAASGFAVLPDALLLAILVLCVVRRRPALASLAALGLCLLRPDGVVFAVPLLLYLLLQQPRRSRAPGTVAALFVLPGAAYFLWRWHYFGELFPLPFLVKSDFHRDLGVFVSGSVRSSLVPLLFTAIVLTPVAMLRKRRNLWLALCLAGVPTAFYWMMRLDQNVGGRFFYYLPVAAAILIAINWQALAGRRAIVLRTAFAAWLALLAAPLYREWLTFRYMQFANVKSIAEALARMPRHGTLLVSEAGFLPYYSGWTTYDAWGLNTAEFAHRPFHREDVARLRPDLIVLHPDLSESCLVQPTWQLEYTDRMWPHMTRNIILGADRVSAATRGSSQNPPGYRLWLTSYGSEFYRRRKHWQYGEGDRECWLVRADSPLRAGIEQILLDHHGVPTAKALLLEQQHRPLAP